MAGLLEWLQEVLKGKEVMKRAAFGVVAVLLFLAVPINLLAMNYESHDRSGNYVAWDYSYNILQTCEPGGIVFTNGDNDTFPLWYLQEVEGIRRDVRVICLSLLNTHWYIRQLRDQEPRVPMNLSDRAVDNLFPIPWETKQIGIPVPKDVQEHERKRLEDQYGPDYQQSYPDTIAFTLAPTFPENNPEGLRVQDLMVLRILEASRWKRPIYFAVTVSHENQLNLDRYLRMDGLAYKVTPYPVQDIDEKALRTNLLEKYQYRGLNDPDVFFNTGTVKLLINVRQAFMQLARHYINHGKKDEAAFVLNEMLARIPEENIPYANERIAISVAEHFRRAGLPGDHENRMQRVIPGRQMSRQDHLELAAYFAQIIHNYDKAEEIYLRLIQEDVNDVQAYSGLIQTYRIARKYDQAVALLEDWLMRHPSDPNAQKELDDLRRLAAMDTTQAPAQQPFE